MRPKLRMAGVCVAVVAGLFMSSRVASASPQQEDMKTRHESMMTRMETLDARIATLTQQMNTSAGEAKNSAMAALLNTILEQHKTMRSEMMMRMSRGNTPPEPSAESEEMCAMEQPAPSAAPSHTHPAN